MLLRFFNSSEVVTLIDVGANDGAWSKKFLDIYPNAFVLAVEPIPSNYQRLLAAHSGDARIVALNSAVSEQPGRLKLSSTKPIHPASARPLTVTINKSPITAQP